MSIENQKAILSEYIDKQGRTLHNVYVDDGISGTAFERPDVKRLLEDANQGIINTILVNDMSRFGRNYIMVSTSTMCFRYTTFDSLRLTTT